MLAIPTTSHTCHNLLSAEHDPLAVDTLIAKEVKEGFMMGPFKQPPFPEYY